MVFAPSSVGPAEKDLSQHGGIVVDLVPGGIDEGDRAHPRQPAQAPQLARMVLQLGTIAATELVPPPRVVAEPGSQGGTGRDLLHPGFDVRLALAEPARPQP